MLWLRYVGFALAVGGAWWFGAELAARALGARTRLTRVALGSGAGLVALGVPLLWLPRILPPGQALLLSGLALGAAAALLRRWPAAPAEVDSPRAALALGSLVVLVYLSALAFWIDGVTGGGDVATRYLHSGVATGIARGNFPVRNPYEPDYALQYRVTFHTLAAGAMDLLDAPARAVMPQAVAATAAILVLTAFGVLRAVAGITAALVGAALTYAWGPLYWVAALLAARERGLGDVLGVIVEQPDTIAWSGILLGGPFTMPTHNPTVSFAMIPAFVTAHTAWVAMRGRARPLLRWGGVAAGLTYLGAANEFLLFTLPAGLLLVLWVRGGLRFQGVRRPMLATLGATGVALVLDLTTPGVLAGFLRGDPDVARLQPGLNTTHFGSLPSWGYNSDGPWITWPVTGYHDVALLSPEFLVDGGSVVGLLAVALLWIAWCRGRSSALPWAALATANVAPAIVFRLGHSGADFYRVLHAGVTLAVPALALAAAEAFARAPRWRPLLVPAATALGGLLAGGFLATMIAWPRMVAQAQSDRPAIPAGAAEFLRSTRVDDRLLVLPGAQTAFALYDGLSPQITADIAAETGQFIPYGYHHLSHAERYAARYGWAQRSLLDSDLRELRVRYVYADPRVLDAVQADAIAAKLADGRFREAYRDPGGTAVIYAFSPA